MSEEVENTQSRPPVQKAKRQRAGSQVRTGAGTGGQGAGTQPRKDAGSRRAQRSGSTAERRASKASAQRGRRAGSSRGQGGAQANRRPQRDQEAARTQGKASQGGAPRGNKPASHARAGKSGPITVPLVPMLLILVVCVVSAVLITRHVVTRQLGAAQVAATSSTTQVEGRTNQVGQSDSKATATEGSASSASQATSSASDASGSEQAQGQGTSKDEDDKDKDATKPGSSAGGVEDPWVSSGTYTTGDPTLDEEVKAFCDSIADKSMSLDAAALEVYKGIAWSEYVERDDAQHPAGKDWRIEYARKYYEHDCSGNCYEFAAFLMYCLQYLGFEDAMAQGVLIELQSGGWGDHGIVYVTNTDGSSCLCDTSRGTDGWMLSDGAYNVQIQDFENA